jgi:hypothetical protein
MADIVAKVNNPEAITKKLVGKGQKRVRIDRNSLPEDNQLE